MKKVVALILALAMILSLAACGGGGNTPSTTGAPTTTKSGESQAPQTTQSGSDKPLAGTYDITVWVADAIVDLTKKQIDDYNKTNEDGIVINATVEPVGEGDAATQMITDVEAGGDIFCFAQDQFARLVQANALSRLGDQAGAMVKASNDEGAVLAATLDGTMYAYPLTADNGYFMYYDKRYILEEDLGSLEKIIADCEKNEKYFSMETHTSAWYMASFFFATGCVSEWKTDKDGKWELNDTFNSANGLIACKGMKKLLDSKFYISSGDEAGLGSGGCAVVVSGPWAFKTAEGILKENLGAAPLPSFEVDGKSYHMGSYRGFKLLGVKTQGDPVRNAALHKLAQYLTGEKAQMERFDEAAWGPSNLEDQKNEKVLANKGLTALREQYPYSTLQGQIGGAWWDIAKVIAAEVKEAKSDADMQKALDNYTKALEEFINMDPEAAKAWGVIGGICGTSWDTDFPMKEVSANVFESDVLQLKAGEELKCRQGASWDVNYGENGLNGANVVVPADGEYIVQLDLNTETITLKTK
ncbi:MAG: extracellular solute-binding protein [Lachnospiraceae bacterium]|nr:extracellular solute-binding protein [Lachnospiraceae bacterium]